MRIKTIMGVCFFLLLFWNPAIVKGQDQRQARDLIMDNLDLNEVSKATEDSLPTNLSFEDIMNSLMDESDNRALLELIGESVLQLLNREVVQWKSMLVQIIGIVIIFSLINRFIVVPNSYVTDMSFMMIYASLMVLLIETFNWVGEIVVEGLQAMLNFLEVLIPAYTLSMVLSGNASSGSMFYTFTFGIIYVMEWCLKLIIIPGINAYVLLELLNNVYREDYFSKLAKLLYKAVNYMLKTSLAIVAGLGVVQSLIGSAKDRIADSLILKSFTAVPGVGKIAGNAGEIMLGCGMLIKNSVGATGLIVLVFIAMIPFAKVFVFDISYHFLAAILQPVADRRLVEGLDGVARGGNLYLKLLLYAFLLFFITIAISSSATSFIH